jgi:hypothetical protein
MKKTMMWRGSHPDEERALAFGKDLERRPIPYVDTDIVNEEAYKLGKRLLNGRNMMHAYPGDASAPDYERRRAAEVVERTIRCRGRLA